MTRVGRRGFLSGLLGVVAAASVPIGWVGRAFGAAATPTSPAEKVASLFSDPVGVARIGTAYLGVAPDEGSVDVLLAALAPAGQSPEEWWTAVGVRELRLTVRTAAHADFVAGDVVDLEGWQLARTEARLAALFVVTQLPG